MLVQMKVGMTQGEVLVEHVDGFGVSDLGRQMLNLSIFGRQELSRDVSRDDMAM